MATVMPFCSWGPSMSCSCQASVEKKNKAKSEIVAHSSTSPYSLWLQFPNTPKLTEHTIDKDRVHPQRTLLPLATLYSVEIVPVQGFVLEEQLHHAGDVHRGGFLVAQELDILLPNALALPHGRFQTLDLVRRR
uniref:(northern house mosquito) hypothetical protein n=1 Tax=Culex pipiens TaxID=7175 RepID=A0A8D8C775_CULPI